MDFYKILMGGVGVGMSNFDRLFAEKHGGGGSIQEITGTLPLTFKTSSDALIDYKIYGNTVDEEGVGVKTENLFDPNAKNVDNGYIAQSVIGYPDGKIGSLYWAYVTEYIPVDSNTNYVMFMNLYRSLYSDNARGLVFYDENKDFISAIRGCSALNEVTYETPGSGRISFTTPENCRYIRTNVDTQATMLMLVEAPTPPPAYIPYGYKLPMISRTENLFDGNYARAYIDTANYTYQTENNTRTAVVKVEPNTTYIVKKFDTSNRFIISEAPEYPQSGRRYNVLNSINKSAETITTGNDTIYILVYVSNNNFEPRLTVTKGLTEPDLFIPYYNVETPIYIGDSQLMEGEYVDYEEQKIYKLINGVLTPTDPPVPLPELPAFTDANTVIDYEETPVPEEVELTYKP